MTKKKKAKTFKRASNQPSPALRRELESAAALHQRGDHQAALVLLIKCAKQYPRSEPVFVALLDLCQEMKDWRTLAFYSEQLLTFEKGEGRADTLNNMVYAYMHLIYPALAWKTAKELIARYPNFEHMAQVKSFVEKTEPWLREQSQLIQVEAGMEDKRLDLMAEHDQIRFYTESGYPEYAIPLARTLLAKIPGTISVLNNLTMAYFLTGDVESATETAQQALARDPQNYHALSNMFRIAFLTARFEEAQEYATRLQQVVGDDSELLIKQAEVNAFLGNHEQVMAAYKQASVEDRALHPLLLHLAAAATYYLGEHKKAWRLWQEALRLSPAFGMATNSLAERKLPESQRHVPWYWAYDYWFPGDFRQKFDQLFTLANRKTKDSQVAERVTALLAKYPYLPKLFPHMLAYGDKATREFVVLLIRIVNNPDLMAILYEFAQSQNGPDQFRIEALQYVAQKRPEMLPSSRQVSMWVGGQQTELLMMGFTITHEPSYPSDIPDEIAEKHDEAYQLLLREKAEAAEPLLKEVIAAAPDLPSVYNHLALAYEMQGRKEEAYQIVKETLDRFPDYLFARAAMARRLAQEKRFEEARTLLDPLLRLTELHITEFRAMVMAEMELALAEKRSDVARSWLNMWRNLEEDHLNQDMWQRRIDGGEGFLNRWKDLLYSSRS